MVEQNRTDRLSEITQRMIGATAEKIPNTPAESTARPTSSASAALSGGLSAQVAGGFDAVAEELDKRARDFRNHLHLLEQQKPALEAARSTCAAALERLAHAHSSVQENSRALFETIQSARAGNLGGSLGDDFQSALRAGEDLEAVAGSVSAQLLWLRAAWEQYAMSILQAQKLREELLSR